MQASATPLVVDPRQLPAVLRSRLSPVEQGRRIWVLHRRRVLQAGLVLAALLAVFVIYEARDRIGEAASGLLKLAQGEVVEAGFGVAAIEITGQALTRERDIFAALGMEPGTSTFNFDAEAARARIESLPAVASATIRKIYPDRVVVAIVEKVPVARWRVDGFTFLVNGLGEQLAEAGGGFGNLPLVIGDGAADDALVMIRALERHASLKTGLVALSRIGDRRWDMIFETGLRVQLPEEGVAQALSNLEQYQADYRLLDRDVTRIDLRVPGLVAVRPTELPDAKDSKKKKS